MAYRVIRLAAGKGQVQLLPNKCPFLFSRRDNDRCGDPVRIAPGAVYCDRHRYLENAGCAEHDKVGCKHEDCRQ